MMTIKKINRLAEKYIMYLVLLWVKASTSGWWPEKAECGVEKRSFAEGRNGWGPCQLHPGTHVVCPGCFLPDLTW